MKIGSRARISFVAALLVAAPLSSAFAQPSGNGYLFHRPTGTITLRGGYLASSTAGQPFEIMRAQTTVGERSFDGANVGLDLSFFLPRRFDVGLFVEGSARSNKPEYREWEEEGRPIRHTNTLSRAAIGANVRYNLKERGRSISTLAWIPAHYVPYVGIGGGVMSYDLKQSGDFVDESATTNNIFTDELVSDGYGAMGQVFTGIDYRIGARWSLLSEARYTRASAKLSGDYIGMGRIDLSGLAVNVGTSFRF